MTTIPNHIDVSTARTTYIASVVERAFADREYRPNSRSDDAEVVFTRKEAAADWDAAEGGFRVYMASLGGCNGYMPSPEQSLEYALDNFPVETDCEQCVWTAFQEAAE